MLQVVGKMRIDLIKAWGQKVSSTVYVMKGARNNPLGKPEVRKTVRVVKEEVQSKHSKLFSEFKFYQIYLRFLSMTLLFQYVLVCADESADKTERSKRP